VSNLLDGTKDFPSEATARGRFAEQVRLSFRLIFTLGIPPFLMAGRLAAGVVSSELVEKELVEELEEELQVTRALLAKELESEDSRKELVLDLETRLGDGIT